MEDFRLWATNGLSLAGGFLAKLKEESEAKSLVEELLLEDETLLNSWTCFKSIVSDVWMVFCLSTTPLSTRRPLALCKSVENSSSIRSTTTYQMPHALPGYPPTSKCRIPMVFLDSLLSEDERLNSSWSLQKKALLRKKSNIFNGFFMYFLLCKKKILYKRVLIAVKCFCGKLQHPHLKKLDQSMQLEYTKPLFDILF